MSSTPDRIEQFRHTWDSPPGIRGFLTEVNNQPLGKRFMVTALSFFLIGGALALLIRIQLTVPDNTFLGPEVYNQAFTMHGSTMMYLFAVPFLEGLALYLLPMMIGSRDVAFPRLTAFSYWTYLFGGLLFYASFLIGAAPDVGWFAYTPLSTSRFSGIGVDFWLLGLSMVEIAGITAGAEIGVTILKMRAPGMSLNRLPLFAWAMLAVAVMIVFAFTTLLMATVLLEMDRTVGTQFFDSHHGGNSLLWQHLFWFFGHPEVYIIFIPATGIVSMVVTAFAGRIIGYTLIAVAILVTAFVSFGLWVHHMYTTGLPPLSMNFFAAASLMIALASGTQVFAWIASLWGRAPVFSTPLLFVLGFVFIFVLGGMTGVMIAVVPFDWQVHDTFFIVAHFHYVLIGGAVFPILAGLYYWYPKITGRMLRESLGKWAFWLSFIGFNVTFFPMHIMGFLGMPRRVYTYSSELGLEYYNIAATIGAFLLALGFLLFFWDALVSLRSGRIADKNPWGGDSLEWSIESPPPKYSFFAPPVVADRHPVWAGEPPEGEYQTARRASSALRAEPANWRASLCTTVLHAVPQSIQYLPGPCWPPLVVALGLVLGFVGILLKSYLVAPVGLVIAIGGLFAWLWPNETVLRKLHESDLPERTGLPIFSRGSSSTAWWATVSLIAVLATVFGTLAYSYYYIRLYSDRWPQGDILPPRWILPLVFHLLLAGSAGAHFWAARGYESDNHTSTRLGLAAALGLAIVFLGLQLFHLSGLTFAPQTNAYGSLFYTVIWILMLFVLVAVVLNVATLIGTWRKPGDQGGITGLQMQITTMFWYFMVVISVLVFLMLYLSPYII